MTYQMFYVDRDVKRIFALRSVFTFLQKVILVDVALLSLAPVVGGATDSNDGRATLFGGATIIMWLSAATIM